MESNAYSDQPRPPHAHGPPDELATLTAAVDGLAARGLDGLADPALAEEVLTLRRLVDRLEGQRLKTLAAVDARGAAEPTTTNRSARPRAGSGPGYTSVPHRRQFGPDRPGPVPRPPPQTAQALGEGSISAAHAAVVASGTSDLPDHVRGGGRAGPGRGGPPAGPTRAATGGLGICAWSPTPTAPTRRPSAAMPGGGCG
jgi:hypothetical protein